MSEIEVSILIDDEINYQIKRKSPILGLKFLKYNHFVEIAKPISQQLEEFQGGTSIYIESSWEFTFSTDTFKDEDSLTYVAMREIGDGEYKTLTADDWLQFSAKDRKLFGLCPQDNFLDVIKFKVVASDG